MANKQNTTFIEKIKNLLRKDINMSHQTLADKLKTYKSKVSYYMKTWDLREVVKNEN